MIINFFTFILLYFSNLRKLREGHNFVKKNMRNSILIYRSHVESISKLNDPNLELEIYKAIFTYCLDGVEPKLTGVADAIFTSIKVNLDNAMKRYAASVENGKKGGRPKKLD